MKQSNLAKHSNILTLIFAWLGCDMERMVHHADAMETRMTKPASNQPRSLAAFVAAKAEFDGLVADLQRMSADHFGADPEAVLWGTTASLEHWNSLLAQVTDAHYRRGEHAA